MLKNRVRIFVNLIVYIAIIFTSYTCYAGITSVEISIGCNENQQRIKRYVYAGSPDTQLSLVTNGIKVAGISDLVEDWDDFKSRYLTPQTDSSHDVYNVAAPMIIAECTSVNEKLESDSTNIYKDMWPVGTTLVCEKGDGIEISMWTPNDPNPNKYRYAATLIINKDDPKVNKTEVTKFTSTINLRGMIPTDEAKDSN